MFFPVSVPGSGEAHRDIFCIRSRTAATHTHAPVVLPPRSASGARRLECARPVPAPFTASHPRQTASVGAPVAHTCTRPEHLHATAVPDELKIRMWRRAPSFAVQSKRLHRRAQYMAARNLDSSELDVRRCCRLFVIELATLSRSECICRMVFTRSCSTAREGSRAGVGCRREGG